MVIFSSIALSIFSWNIPSILNNDAILEAQSQSDVNTKTEPLPTNLKPLEEPWQEKQPDPECNHIPAPPNNIEQRSHKAQIEEAENKNS